jgi:hypothetical protein
MPATYLNAAAELRISALLAIKNDRPSISHLSIVADMPGSLCDANHRSQKKFYLVEKTNGLPKGLLFEKPIIWVSLAL